MIRRLIIRLFFGTVIAIEM